MLQSSFQRETPRSASVKLDVDVIKGHELFHGLHAGPGTFFYSSLTLLLTPRTLASPSLTTRAAAVRGRAGEGRGEEGCATHDGHAELPREGNASG